MHKYREWIILFFATVLSSIAIIAVLNIHYFSTASENQVEWGQIVSAVVSAVALIFVVAAIIIQTLDIKDARKEAEDTKKIALATLRSQIYKDFHDFNKGFDEKSRKIIVSFFSSVAKTLESRAQAGESPFMKPVDWSEECRKKMIEMKILDPDGIFTKENLRDSIRIDADEKIHWHSIHLHFHTHSTGFNFLLQKEFNLAKSIKSGTKRYGTAKYLVVKPGLSGSLNTDEEYEDIFHKHFQGKILSIARQLLILLEEARSLGCRNRCLAYMRDKHLVLLTHYLVLMQEQHIKRIESQRLPFFDKITGTFQSNMEQVSLRVDDVRTI